MIRPAIVPHAKPDVSKYDIENPYPIVEYDELGNELAAKNHHQQLLLHRNEPVLHEIQFDTDKVLLMHIGLENLPCRPVQDTEPTELPLPRESIGIDLSWLSSSKGALCVQERAILILLFLILILCRTSA